MNPFTEHTGKQGLTYLEHWYFAMGVAWRLLNSAVAFILHATFPFVHIERRLDLEATRDYIRGRNQWLTAVKKRKALTEAENREYIPDLTTLN